MQALSAMCLALQGLFLFPLTAPDAAGLDTPAPSTASLACINMRRRAFRGILLGSWQLGGLGGAQSIQGSAPSIAGGLAFG